MTFIQTFESILSKNKLVSRSDDDDDNSFVANGHLEYVIALIILVFSIGLLCWLLWFLRRQKARNQRLAKENEPVLPLYNDGGYNASNNNHNPRGLTIQTSDGNGRRSIVMFNRDGQPMLSNPQSPPYSPDNVPEIRITFPDEADEAGHTKSGRVVVVRLGDSTVGMEPLDEKEQLPAYEKESKDQFYSIDIEKIGGLKEKGDNYYH